LTPGGCSNESLTGKILCKVPCNATGTFPTERIGDMETGHARIGGENGQTSDRAMTGYGYALLTFSFRKWVANEMQGP